APTGRAAAVRREHAGDRRGRARACATGTGIRRSVLAIQHPVRRAIGPGHVGTDKRRTSMIEPLFGAAPPTWASVASPGFGWPTQAANRPIVAAGFGLPQA